MKPTTRWTSEFLGTFLLVFFGTGAVVVGDRFPGMLPHTAIAATFGLVVLAMIAAIGDISGAHINPAVTFGFWLARRFPGRDVAPYLFAQILGATAASGLLRGLFPSHRTLGATVPVCRPGTAFGIEVLLTFALMFVILHVSHGAKEKGTMAGLAVAGTVALSALVGGPITGASMNPARSLGPAVISGAYASLWIYLVAPFCGAALAVLSCALLRDRCCAFSLRAVDDHE